MVDFGSRMYINYPALRQTKSEEDYIIKNLKYEGYGALIHFAESSF